jgi:hypothetical protein
MNKKFRAYVLIFLIAVPSFITIAIDLPAQEILKISYHTNVMMFNPIDLRTENHSPDDSIEIRRIFNRRRIIRRIEEFFRLTERWGSLHRSGLSIRRTDF